MKKVLWILFSVFAITVTACAQSATPAAIPTVSLDSGCATVIFFKRCNRIGDRRPCEKSGIGIPARGRSENGRSGRGRFGQREPASRHA